MTTPEEIAGLVAWLQRMDGFMGSSQYCRVADALTALVKERDDLRAHGLEALRLAHEKHAAVEAERDELRERFDKERAAKVQWSEHTTNCAKALKAAEAERDALKASLTEALEVVRVAEQLASVASDWNLDEVEIDGEMQSIYAVLAKFTALLAKHGGGKTDAE